MVLCPCRRLYHTPPLRAEAAPHARPHTPPPLPRLAIPFLGSSRPLLRRRASDVTSAVRVARRRRTDMVMQASMWVLGVAAVERQLCRSECGTSCGLQHSKRPLARRNLRGGRPIPPLPASTRRTAGSTHTLPLFLGSSTIPYRAKIRNPAYPWRPNVNFNRTLSGRVAR